VCLSLTEGVGMSADESSYISDATRIKAELRATNQRIDSLSERVDKRFEWIDQRISDLKDSLVSAKLWALVPWAVLVTALLFYALAHGFKGV
jgi:hypothetical protein